MNSARASAAAIGLENGVEAKKRRNLGRVLVQGVKRKNPKKPGKFRKEFIVRIIAPNGRQIGTAGESYIRKDYAIAYAKSVARGQGFARATENWPVYIDGELSA